MKLLVTFTIPSPLNRKYTPKYFHTHNDMYWFTGNQTLKTIYSLNIFLKDIEEGRLIKVRQ